MNIKKVTAARQKRRAARLKALKQRMGQAPDERPTVTTTTKAVTEDGREVEITEERPAHAHETAAAEREHMADVVARKRENSPKARADAAREQARKDGMPKDVSAEDFADAFTEQLKELRKRRRGLRFSGDTIRKIAPNTFIHSKA